MAKLVMLLCTVLLIVACGAPAEQAATNETPRTQPVAQATPEPTAMPEPTATPEPTPEPTIAPQAEPTASALPANNGEVPAGLTDAATAAFQLAGIPVEDVVVYDEETDPNSLLGRPGQYIGKVSWRDTRVATSGEPGTDTGGSLEVFPDRASLEARKSYIEEVTAGNAMLAGYMYDNGNMLLRLTNELTPTQAQEYNNVFQAVPSP